MFEEKLDDLIGKMTGTSGNNLDKVKSDAISLLRENDVEGFTTLMTKHASGGTMGPPSTPGGMKPGALSATVQEVGGSLVKLKDHLNKFFE